MCYNKFCSDTEDIGFILHTYFPCVANQMANKKQQTVSFHVDEILSSHNDSKVNELFFSMTKQSLWYLWGSTGNPR